MRECDDDRHGTAGAGAPSDPGPDEAPADGLVEAVSDLLDDLVEAPASDDDPA